MNKKTWFMAVLLLCTFGVLRAETTLYTLEQLFDLADANAKSLKPYATAILEADEQVKNMRNACLPDLTLGLSASYIGDGHLIERDFSAAQNAPMPHFGNNASLEFTQVIYAGGALLAANEIAKLQAENATLSLENQRQVLYYRILGYYLDLFKMHNLVRVYDENISQTQQVLEQMQLKGTEGIVLQNDVTRYELLLATLQLGKTKLENTISILNHDLKTLVGLTDDVQIQPDSAMLNLVLPQEGEQFWTAQAAQNLNLKQLETGIKLSEQATKAENAKRLPSIVFRAADHFDGPILIEVPPINQNFNYWYVGLGIQYNFGELYKSKRAVSKAKLATRRLQEQYADTKEQTEMALRADYIKYIEAYQELNTQKKSVELAQQNYDIVANRYQNELALITEMLDASNAKLSAEVQLINAKIDILFNYYTLKFKSGNL